MYSIRPKEKNNIERLENGKWKEMLATDGSGDGIFSQFSMLAECAMKRVMPFTKCKEFTMPN